jgi:hypothetical protein
MVGISIKEKTPDQCHLPADSDKRYLSPRSKRTRVVVCCNAGISHRLRVMRQFGAKSKKTLGAWAGNGLASKCGDDKDAIAMI